MCKTIFEKFDEREPISHTLIDTNLCARKLHGYNDVEEFSKAYTALVNTDHPETLVPTDNYDSSNLFYSSNVCYVKNEKSKHRYVIGTKKSVYTLCPFCEPFAKIGYGPSTIPMKRNGVSVLVDSTLPMFYETDEYEKHLALEHGVFKNSVADIPFVGICMSGYVKHMPVIICPYAMRHRSKKPCLSMWHFNPDSKTPFKAYFKHVYEYHQLKLKDIYLEAAATYESSIKTQTDKQLDNVFYPFSTHNFEKSLKTLHLSCGNLTIDPILTSSDYNEHRRAENYIIKWDRSSSTWPEPSPSGLNNATFHISTEDKEEEFPYTDNPISGPVGRISVATALEDVSIVSELCEAKNGTESSACSTFDSSPGLPQSSSSSSDAFTFSSSSTIGSSFSSHPSGSSSSSFDSSSASSVVSDAEDTSSSSSSSSSQTSQFSDSLPTLSSQSSSNSIPINLFPPGLPIPEHLLNPDIPLPPLMFFDLFDFDPPRHTVAPIPIDADHGDLATRENFAAHYHDHFGTRGNEEDLEERWLRYRITGEVDLTMEERGINPLLYTEELEQFVQEQLNDEEIDDEATLVEQEQPLEEQQPLEQTFGEVSTPTFHTLEEKENIAIEEEESLDSQEIEDTPRPRYQPRISVQIGNALVPFVTNFNPSPPSSIINNDNGDETVVNDDNVQNTTVANIGPRTLRRSQGVRVVPAPSVLSVARERGPLVDITNTYHHRDQEQ